VSPINSLTFINKIFRKEFLREIQFMKTLGYHAHLLNMLGCDSSPRLPLLILELCDRGDLLRLLRIEKPNWNNDYRRIEQIDEKGAKSDVSLTLKDMYSFAWQISDAAVSFEVSI
jgi:serine/threonine protein kinase